MKSAWTRITWCLLAAALLGLACQACSFLPENNRPNPTLTAVHETAVFLATQAQQEEPDEEADLATPGPVPGEATNTISPPGEAPIETQTPLPAVPDDKMITETAQAAPVVAELSIYGLDPSGGRVGWVHPPFSQEVSGYQEFTSRNDYMQVVAADFALAADITWDTQYGSSGCGYMFRSDGDQNKPNLYMVLATRFGNGHVIFTALAEGEVANIHDFYPRTEDRSFQWENGTTNRLAVVARGTLIEIYTNGVKIGEVDTTKPPARLPSPPKPQAPTDKKNIPAMDLYEKELKEYQDIVNQTESTYQTAVKNYMNRPAVFDEGFLAMVTASESGKTVCTFSDAWLWLIDPQN